MALLRSNIGWLKADPNSLLEDEELEDALWSELDDDEEPQNESLPKPWTQTLQSRAPWVCWLLEPPLAEMACSREAAAAEACLSSV